MNCGDGLRWACHLDPRGALPPEDVEEEVAGCPSDQRSRLATADIRSHARLRPLDLEPDTAETTTEVAASPKHVSPQGGVELRCQQARAHPVGSPHILVMNEELVQVGDRADPADAEDPRGRPRPDPEHQPPEVPPIRDVRSPPLREVLERTGEHHA